MPSYERIMALRNNPEAALTPEPAPSTLTPVDPNDPNKLAVMLDKVSERALAKLDEILSLPLATADGNLLRAQSAAVNVALATQIKVDELKLRERHSPDIMTRIIQMMREEQEKLRLLEESNPES
jgi:hypothetical protein